MLHHGLQAFQIFHGVAAVVAALGFFSLWKRSKFWLPTYVHVMAAISLVLGIGFVWLVSTAPRLPDPSGPSPRTQHFAQLLLPLIFPALVYFFFIFYGGQQAAFSRSLMSTPCPFCKAPSPARVNDGLVHFSQPRCGNCGQLPPSHSA